MTIEKELISKSYYETLMEGNTYDHPLKVLGDMYVEERQKETFDLSYIRFAQGEVYFQFRDFETAIFKWEKIANELKPWALKNIADAHYELDLLSVAEEYYSAVKTDSEVLQTEVLLQLFSLYMRLENLGLAADSIKNAVALNPDYPDVTTVARTFFEDHQDWDNAVELAVNEAIRTESLSWFEVLEKYVEQGHTEKIDPTYFVGALMTLAEIDLSHFESLSSALWNSYRESDKYFSWLEEINPLLLNMDLGRPFVWKKLSTLYKDSYFELISGEFLIRDFSHLIPSHLNNWLKIATASDALAASAAVISWNEVFPSDLGDDLVHRAEKMFKGLQRDPIAMNEALRLFESILKWAKREGFKLDDHFEWMVGELLDLNHYHLLISGSATKGRSPFVNLLLGEKSMGGYPAALEEGVEMQAATDEEAEFRSLRQPLRSQQALIPCRMSSTLITESELSMIDTPILVDQRRLSDQVIQYLHLADCLVFVLNVDLNLSGKELELAIRMKEQAPLLPIHFILWKTDRIAGSQVSMELVEKTVSRIEDYFPNAKVSAFSSVDGESQLRELSAFVEANMDDDHLEEERTTRILYYIKMSIKYLLEKRAEMENAIMDKIEWNEVMAAKLEGAEHQLSDMEEQKAQAMKTSYSQILDQLDRNLMTKIPELLRNCSEMVREDSDFGKLHLELNEEMNRRMMRFIEETALPELKDAIQEWIDDCGREFKDSQVFLEELSESFNQLYGEEKLILNCDFKVLDDWKRDVNRLTRGSIQVEKANILLRTTPSQLLFKSAGKLLGAISKKDMLYNKYKQFIETKDYSQTAEWVTDKVLQPFELFERSLGRDINMFFSPPAEVLNKTLLETQQDTAGKRETLGQLQKNPEIYRDPLTLFDLKRRQYEQMGHRDRSTVPVDR